MELKVLDINGKETKKSVTLDAKVFGIEPNDHSIYLDVKNSWRTLVRVRTNLKSVQR